MPRLATRLVIAAALGLLAAAAPAQAAWETPQRLDQTSEGFGSSSAGDVAVGDNGLATIFFFQADDAGAKLYATRRGAEDTLWLTPPWHVTKHPTGSFSIEAAPDGATAGAYRGAEGTDDGGTPLPVDDTDVYEVVGLGWPASATAERPKTGDLGDQASETLPPIDADGKGRGWTAFIDAAMNLKIVRFDLADPTKPGQTFTVEPVELGPSQENQNLDETESRSNPRIDVNADGDVVVSFVETRRQLSEDSQEPIAVEKVYAVRKLDGRTPDVFEGPFVVSHRDAGEAVNEHDPAIVENGDATILFAGDPTRDTEDPNSEGPDRVFARRWLATGASPRDPSEGPEFVSSSAPGAPDVSNLRAEAGPDGRVTAAWVQGSSQLNSAERTTSWTVPQVLSANTSSYDVAVDTAGVATAVFRESIAVKARRRAPDQQWAPADTISTTPASTAVAPRVDTGAPLQADAYFVQNDGVRRGAFATRFSGQPPVEPPAPVLPDTGDCPNDIEILVGDGSANTIDGSDERETILGGEGDDTLSGGGGDDCVRGQDGNDTVSGDDGNDDVGGGEGDDGLTGGDGNDRLSGGGGADSLNGNDGDDTGSGGDGNDTVDGSTGNDLLFGDAGDDTIRGGTGDDALGGIDGDDTIYGQAGRNVLAGGVGNDRLVGGPETDTVLGDDGDDNVSGGGGNDEVSGAEGNDRVRGGSGRNVLDGAGGDDNIRGGSQSDRARGGDGRDTLFGLAGSDRLYGGAGVDKAYGGSGVDRLFGKSGRDRLRGGNGADRLSGGSAKDRLFGDNGKDRLYGGAGGDVMNPGSSRDRVYGGAGRDRISTVDNKRDLVDCGAGRDRVVADAVDRVRKNCERVRRRA